MSRRSAGRNNNRNNNRNNGRGGRKGGDQMPTERATPMNEEDVRNAERVSFLDSLLAITGQNVELHLKDGKKITGIMHTFSDTKQSTFEYVLKGAKTPEGTEGPTGPRGYVTIRVPSDKVLQLVIPSIVLQRNVSAGSFATDSAISGTSSQHLMDRELEQVNQSWLECDLPPEGLNDATTMDQDGKWDQFKANEKITGKAAQFDESIYTTSLDTSKISKEQSAHAQKLAQEIESEAHDGNVHIAQERGQAIDTGKLDEEDLFSGVIREQPAEQKKPAEPEKQPEKKTPFKFNPNAASFTPKAFKPVTTTTTAQPAPPAQQQQPPQQQPQMMPAAYFGMQNMPMNMQMANMQMPMMYSPQYQPQQYYPQGYPQYPAPYYANGGH